MCEPFAGTAAPWNGATHTLTLTPPTPTPQTGDTIAIDLSFDVGPNNGPVALAAGTVTPTATAIIAVDGTPVETVNLAGPALGAVPANGPMPGASLSGSFVASGAGVTTVTIERYIFDAPSFGIAIPCDAGTNPKTNPPVPTSIVESVTVAAATNHQVTITSMTGQDPSVLYYMRRGNTINVDATGFTPGATATLTVCDVDGTDCTTLNSTATLDGNGDAPLSLAVPANAGAAANWSSGARAVSVTDGTLTKLVPITVLGNPTITLNPDAGGVGTIVTITGTEYNPLGQVTFGTMVPGPGFPPVQPSTDTPASTTAAADGTWVATFTVGDTATNFLAASTGAVLGNVPLTGYRAFTLSADECIATAAPCSLDYNLQQSVNPGNLVLSRTPGTSTIVFSDVTTSTTAQSSSGALDPVTVTDARGGTLGWSLVGRVTDFETTAGPSGPVIPAGNVSWTPACGDAAGATENRTAANAGSAGNLSSTADATLCSLDADASGTGGEYEASAAMAVEVPSFQTAADYAAVLTITLS